MDAIMGFSPEEIAKNWSPEMRDQLNALSKSVRGLAEMTDLTEDSKVELDTQFAEFIQLFEVLVELPNLDYQNENLELGSVGLALGSQFSRLCTEAEEDIEDEDYDRYVESCELAYQYAAQCYERGNEPAKAATLYDHLVDAAVEAEDQKMADSFREKARVCRGQAEKKTRSEQSVQSEEDETKGRSSRTIETVSAQLTLAVRGVEPHHS